jgi:hypothetical protein
MTRLASIALVLAVVQPTLVAADPALQRRIEEINGSIAFGNTHLPKPIESTDPDDYFYRLNPQVSAVQGALGGAKGGLHESLAEEGASYKKMMADLKAFEALTARVVALLGPREHFAAVTTKHARGEPADGELDKVDAAIEVTAKATAKDAWAASHVAAFKQMAAALRKANGPIATAYGAKKKQQAESTAANALATKVREVRSLAEKQTKLSLAGEAVPDVAIAALESTIAEADKAAPDGGAFLRVDLLGLKILRAWEQADAETSIATLLGGSLAGKGRTSGKNMAVAINAKADQCYMIVGKFAQQADVSTVAGFEWAAPKGKQVVPFTLAGLARTGFVSGFCAYDAMKITAKAELDFQGTKNGLRYAVVSFARTQLPADVTLTLELEDIDHCDLGLWEAMWTKPIPGTLGYDGNEPVIVEQPATVMSSEVIRLNAPWNLISHEKKLTGKAGGSLRFEPKQLEWGAGCPVDAEKQNRRPFAPKSLEIAACIKRVQKKYAGTWSQIDGQRAAARDAGGIAPAVENRATALADKMQKDYAACDKTQAAMAKAMAKLNEKLLDQLLETPPSDSSGRIDRFFRAAKFRY